MVTFQVITADGQSRKSGNKCSSGCDPPAESRGDTKTDSRSLFGWPGTMPFGSAVQISSWEGMVLALLA